MEQNRNEDEQSDFVIANDGAAEWAVQKIRQARDHRDRMVSHLKAQIVAAEDECAETEERMSGPLMRYFHTVPHNITKTQENYKLPSGTLRLKQREPEYKRTETVLAQWLEENEMRDFIKYTPTPKWAELKPLTRVEGSDVVFKETGEIVQGVAAVARDPEFIVEV